MAIVDQYVMRGKGEGESEWSIRGYSETRGVANDFKYGAIISYQFTDR